MGEHGLSNRTHQNTLLIKKVQTNSYSYNHIVAITNTVNTVKIQFNQMISYNSSLIDTHHNTQLALLCLNVFIAKPQNNLTVL